MPRTPVRRPGDRARAGRLAGALVAAATVLAALSPVTIAATAMADAAAQRAAGAPERLEGHGGPVHALAGAPGGALLSASFDNSVGVWDLDTGAVRWLEGHEAAVKALAAWRAADGAVLAASAGDDFTVIVWDVATGTALHRLSGHRGSVAGLAVSADGTRLASAGWDGAVLVWDARTGARLATLEGHDGAVNAAAFRPGGTLLTASADGTLREWDAGTGAAVRTLANHGFAINVLHASEEGGWLAYGAVDGGTRILSLADGSVIADLTLGRRPVLSLDASPDGRHLAVGDGEGHVMVVETAGWAIAHDFALAARGPVWALAFAADGRLAAGGIDNALALVPVEGPPAPVLGTALPQFLRAPGTMGNGERQFRRKCSVCHTLTGDGGRRAGPTLKNLFGRRAGTVPGYTYSRTLDGSAIVWSPQTLDALFDAGPDHYVPGSKMPMQRITSAADRADLIEYLKVHTVGPNGEN